MENFLSGILRSILNAPWFVRNDDARETIKIPTVEITNYANAYLNGVKITQTHQLKTATQFYALFADNTHKHTEY